MAHTTQRQPVCGAAVWTRDKDVFTPSNNTKNTTRNTHTNKNGTIAAGMDTRRWKTTRKTQAQRDKSIETHKERRTKQRLVSTRHHRRRTKLTPCLPCRQTSAVSCPQSLGYGTQTVHQRSDCDCPAGDVQRTWELDNGSLDEVRSSLSRRDIDPASLFRSVGTRGDAAIAFAA